MKTFFRNFNRMQPLAKEEPTVTTEYLRTLEALLQAVDDSANDPPARALALDALADLYDEQGAPGKAAEERAWAARIRAHAAEAAALLEAVRAGEVEVTRETAGVWGSYRLRLGDVVSDVPVIWEPQGGFVAKVSGAGDRLAVDGLGWDYPPHLLGLSDAERAEIVQALTAALAAAAEVTP